MAGRRTRLPKGILRLMLATLIDAPFDDPDWVFETKWDGFRAIAHCRGIETRLYSRNGHDITADYPRIVAALSRVRHEAVIDGELVALDAKRRSRFQLLQRSRKRESRLQYCVFDLMFDGGDDLRYKSLVLRKKRLRAILPRSSVIRFSKHVRRNGIAAFRQAAKRGEEGVIAKRAESPYRSGHRTREWLKIKTSAGQEAVIVGFTEPRRGRKHFGALVLAVRDGKRWRYAGHAGTGFSGDMLASLHTRMKKLVIKRRPIYEPVANENATTWIRPQLVAQMKFTEWTSGGRMRHPVFLGLRSDKKASLVVRERAKARS